ncbi:unnamed protein product [Arabidopsis arenosa]|uniref:DUF1985 domain-containing protein n=1 Tax=Arabidopsis arenosa TaxID=38785 RepID=A0A8S2B4Q0_ARAAE|nr:unnamed protein product [Arabidopsis arenosa]
MSLRKNYLPGFLPWDYESVPLSRHTDVAEFISSVIHFLEENGFHGSFDLLPVVSFDEQSKITSRVKKALKRLGIFPHFVRKIGEPREQQISDIEIRRRIKAWYEGHLANNTRGVLGLMAADGGYIPQLLEIQNEGGFEIVIINRPGVATHSFYTVLSQFPVITDSVAMVQSYQNSAGLASGSGSRFGGNRFGGNGGRGWGGRDQGGYGRGGRDQGGYGRGGRDQGGYGRGGRDQGGYGWGGRDQGGYGWGGRDQGGYGWGGRDQGGYGWGGRDQGGYGWGGRDQGGYGQHQASEYCGPLTITGESAAIQPFPSGSPESLLVEFGKIFDNLITHLSSEEHHELQLAWTTVPVPSHPPVAPTAMLSDLLRMSSGHCLDAQLTEENLEAVLLVGSKAVTSVYWDMETCPVPLGCAPRRISPIGAVEDVPYDILREIYPSGISVPYDGEGEYESTAGRPTEPADASMVEPAKETADTTEPDVSMVKLGSETVGMQTDPTEEAEVDASESHSGNETVAEIRDDAEGQAAVADSDIQLGKESPIEPSTGAVEAAEEELVGASEEEEETDSAQDTYEEEDDAVGNAGEEDEHGDVGTGKDGIEAEEDVGIEEEAAAKDGIEEEAAEASKDVAGITADDDSGNDDDEDDSQPLPPEKMCLDSSEYTKGCKIGTRCNVTETVKLIEKEFKDEAIWFRSHPQFKHEYPEKHEEMGNLRFVKRIFKRTEKIKASDVLAKLKEKKSWKGADKKKLVVLYFLCKILKASSKSDGNIVSFLLRIVDDLDACETYPWGRYSFSEYMKGIRNMMKNLNGSVKPKAQPSFSGFIVPLEILAYEAIPHLGLKYRVPDIDSILVPDQYEKSLLAGIIEDNVDDGLGQIDIIVDSWRERLVEKKKKIWWEGMYQLDQASREIGNKFLENEDPEQEVPEQEVPEKESSDIANLVASINSLTKVVNNGFQAINEKLSDMENRVKTLEVAVASHGPVFTPYGSPVEAQYGTRTDFEGGQPSQPSQTMDLVMYNPISPTVPEQGECRSFLVNS